MSAPTNPTAATAAERATSPTVASPKIADELAEATADTMGSPKATTPAAASASATIDKSPSPVASPPPASPTTATSEKTTTVSPPAGSPTTATSPTSTSATSTSAALAAPPSAAPVDSSVPESSTPAAPAFTPHPNPQVAELQAMFPSVDPTVIEMVLESVGGSHDRAIESLLQMTDPEFKPDPASVRTEEAASQVDLDEEFARALHLQDQEAAERERRANNGGSRSNQAQSQNQNRIPEVLPYQPRVRRARPPQPDPYALSTHEHQLQDRYGDAPAGHNGGGDPPGMIAFEEKLGHFAEAGKQTFNSFFSKAKAKYAELQEQHQASRDEQRQMAEEWREQGDAHAQGRMVGEKRNNSVSDATPGGGRGGRGGLWGGQARASPGARSSSLSSASSVGAAGTIAAQAAPVASRRWNPSDAYDDPAPVRTPSNQSAGRRSPAPALSPTGTGTGSTSPDKAAGSNKIDLSKLGFLPKKKVDLLSTSPVGNAGADRDPNPHVPAAGSGRALVEQIPKTPPAEMSPHTLGDSDDDDDLDYTENPFDRK